MMWKNLLSVSEKFDWFDNDERILLFATGEARDSQRQLGGRRAVCMLFFLTCNRILSVLMLLLSGRQFSDKIVVLNLKD